MKQSIQKIILFAAFFAAGLSNISANAQYVSQAEARVYSDIGTLNYEVADINTGTANYDILGNTPVDDIVNSIVAAFMTSGRNQNVAETNTHTFFRELPGDIGANDLQNGLPVFTGIGVLDAGDRIVFRDEGGAAFRQTVRVYTDGTDLFMASGEGTVRPAPVVAPRTSDMLQVGEFWIDSNTNRQATEISADLYGFVDAVCDTDNGYELQADRITCECPADEFDTGTSCVAIPNCDTASTQLNTATNMCECLDETHRFVDGSTTMCEIPPATPTDANCGANAINDPNDNTMCVCENTETHEFVDGSTTMCELKPGDNTETQNPTTQIPQNRSDNKKRRAESINTATGLLAVGVIAVFLAGGVPSFNMSPDFGYRITESGYYANIGGRADFRKDNWHLYYTANQTNSGGEFADFRYTSGGEYKNDLFAATFSESVAGETANYNFSLSADVDGRLVDFSPVYRLHSEYDKGEFSTRNELNLQSNFRYDGWTINPSAGFRWENTKDFAENARFQINAVHRF